MTDPKLPDITIEGNTFKIEGASADQIRAVMELLCDSAVTKTSQANAYTDQAQEFIHRANVCIKAADELLWVATQLEDIINPPSRWKRFKRYILEGNQY